MSIKALSVAIFILCATAYLYVMVFLMAGCVTVQASVPLCIVPDGGLRAPRDNSDICACREITEEGEEQIRVISCEDN